MTGNSVVIGMISAIILGAIGIRIAGGMPWKGAILSIVFIVGTIAASMVSQNLLLAFIAGAVLAAIVAGAMKIPTKQSANALLGCIIGHLIPVLFM